MLVVINAKILHHSFTSTICENFKSVFFYLYSAKENVESRIQVSFEQLKELKFGVLSLNNT